jgi:hypothetical protein
MIEEEGHYPECQWEPWMNEEECWCPMIHLLREAEETDDYFDWEDGDAS